MYIYIYISIYIYIFTLRINWLLIKRKGICKMLTPIFGRDSKCSSFIYSNMFQ